MSNPNDPPPNYQVPYPPNQAYQGNPDYPPNAPYQNAPSYYPQNPNYNAPPAYNQAYPGNPYPQPPNPYSQPYIAAGNQVAQPRVYPISGPPGYSFIRGSICSIVTLSILVVAEFIFYIMTMFNVPWFGYCYWDFSLNHVTTSWDNYGVKFAGGSYTQAEFYSILCDPDLDFYPACFDLCESLKPLRESKDIMIAFATIAIICAFGVLALVIAKYNKQTLKVPRRIVYLLNLSPLILYIIGFSAYYSNSNFNKHFYNTDSSEQKGYHGYPHNFYWSWSMVFSVIIMAIMTFNFLISRATIGAFFP